MPNKYGKNLPVKMRSQEADTAKQKAAIGQALTSSMVNYKGPKTESPVNAVGVQNKNYVATTGAHGSKVFMDDTVGRKVATKNPSKTKAMKTF